MNEPLTGINDKKYVQCKDLKLDYYLENHFIKLVYDTEKKLKITPYVHYSRIINYHKIRDV